ncbi:MAG: DUF4199 domain-containing protein [Sphingobacteriia bacterium]|nr:DUF4199 domain-containing protein [Sphingobacteriia bacterium]
MEGTKSNAQVALINGLLLGVALVLFSLLMYVIGIAHDSKLQYISYLIIIIGLVLSIKQWRDKYNNGFLTYGQAFSNGFFTILFASIITAIWMIIFFGLIAPGEVENMLRAAEDKMYETQPNMTEEQVEMALKWSKMFMTPVMMGIWGFIGNLIIGTILSALVSIFMKKEKPVFAE